MTLDYDMDGDGKINEVSLVTPGSSCYDKRLALCTNNDPNLIKSGGSFVEDGDMDGDGLWDVGPVNNDDNCDNDGMPNWYESSHGVETTDGRIHIYLMHVMRC